MGQEILQATVLALSKPKANQEMIKLGLFDASGAPLTAGKQMTFQADIAALTSTAAAGSTPTKAEFDALRNDLIAVRTGVNGLLAKLRTAGLMPSS